MSKGRTNRATSLLSIGLTCGTAGALLVSPTGKPSALIVAAAAVLVFIGNVFPISIGRSTNEGSVHQLNWTEFGALIGLACGSPRMAIAATFIGMLLALLTLRRSVAKACLNASAYALQAAIAALVVGQQQGTSLRLAIAMFAFVVANVVGFEVIFHLVGVRRSRHDVISELRSTVVNSMITSMLALIALHLAENAPALLIPYVGLGFAFVLINRANIRMSERFRRTEHLYAFTRKLSSAPHSAGPQLVAGSVHDALNARRVELVLDLGGPDAGIVRSITDSETRTLTWEEWDTLTPTMRAMLGSDAGRLESLDGENVVSAPLPLADRIIGAISVVEPSKNGRKALTGDDIKLVETMAQHAAIWLDNGRLVDELREEARQREHEAFHDALTDLPNRRLFGQRAEVAITEAIEHGMQGAVMLLDLDQFKEVNDALGHAVGDDLLLACGDRIRRLLPQSATLARLGGDEFAVILPTIADPAEPVRIADSIARSLGEPMQVRDMNLRIDVSIGVAFFPSDAIEASHALQRADVAMYTAKQNRTVVELYSSLNDFSSARKLALQADLTKAIDTDQIRLWYQPKVHLQTNEVVGVECLVRWQHPIHGMVYPDEFIPQAEQSGLIGPLSMRILAIALRQQRQWRSEGIEVKVAVNLSVRNLLNTELASKTAELLREYGTDPAEVVMEITETAVMSDPARSRRTLEELAELGVSVAVDDFGIGQSSLAYLQDLPIDEVKIDRCFVDGIERGQDGIAKTVIDLGRNLGLRVVAEGIETEDAYLHLRSIGCEIGQGYFIGRPMPVEALELWLTTRQPHLPAAGRLPTHRVLPLAAASGRRR